MGYSKAFSRQHKCAKHPRNITSHIGFAMNVLGENMTRLENFQKYPKKQPKLKVINTCFRTFLWPEIRTAQGAFQGHGKSFQTSKVDQNEYMDAFTFILRRFWVSREMNKCGAQRLFEAKKMVQVPAQRYKSRRLSQEHFVRKYDQTRKSPKLSQKQPKLKVIRHAFGLSLGLSSKRHGMSPRDMGSHQKGVMRLGTNMWMPLRSFRGNFGFHEK